MQLKDVRIIIIQEPETINEQLPSFVSVHHRVVEAGPLHLHGGNQWDLLLLQRVHQARGDLGGNLRQWIRSLLLV